MSLNTARQSRPGVATERDRTDWRGVGLGLALSCFVAFQQFKLPPVLPSLLSDFHYPQSLAAGFMSIYALIGLLGSVPLGAWMKRRGYGPGLLLGTGSTLLGLVLALLFARFGLILLASRGLEGLTYTAFAIAGPAIATGSARMRDLPLVTGLLASWVPVGQIGAGLLALAASDIALPIADWQLVWLVALAITLLLAVFCWRYSHRQDVGMFTGSAKTRGAVTANTTVTANTDAADHRADPDQTPQPVISPGGGGIRLGHLTDHRRLTTGRLADILAAGIFLLWAAQYFAFMTWLTQFLIERHHVTPQTAVFIYLLPVVVVLGSNLLTGWALSHGLKLIPALLVSLVLQGLVWALNPILSGAVGILALLVYGICSGVIPTCLFNLPHLIAAHRQNGSTKAGHVRAGPEAFAILMTGRNIGVFCGPLVLPQLLSWRGDWNEAALVIAASPWLSAVIAFALARQLR